VVVSAAQVVVSAGKVSGRADRVRGWVSYMRTATTSPEAAGEGGDGPDGGVQADGVGDHAGHEGADGETAVAPEAVGPDPEARQDGWTTSPTGASRVG
jgi:hypothetical protein